MTRGRSTYDNDQITSLILGSINILEEIPIWYQHRNCVAHHGACQKDNERICQQYPNMEYCVADILRFMFKKAIKITYAEFRS